MGEAADVRGSAEGGRYEPAGVTHAGVRDVATRSTSKFYRYSVSRSRVAHGATVASQRWFAIPIWGDGFNGSGAVVSPFGEVKVDPHLFERRPSGSPGWARRWIVLQFVGWLVVALVGCTSPFPTSAYMLSAHLSRTGVWFLDSCFV